MSECNTRALSVLFLVMAMISCSFQRSYAWPGGAGGCLGGQPAVSASHLNRFPTVNTTLEEGMVQVTLDGKSLHSSTTTITAGVEHKLVVSCPSNPFKGILIRLEVPGATSTSAYIISDNDPDLDPAEDCYSPIVGVNHNNPLAKTDVHSVFRIDLLAVSAQVDITVVWQNDYDGSYYAYGNFVLETVANKESGTATEAATSTTDVSTVPPASAPVSTPTTTTTDAAAADATAAPSVTTCLSLGHYCTDTSECCEYPGFGVECRSTCNQIINDTN